MSLVDAVLLGLAGLVGIYLAAWVASRAFFDNKADYNRKLFRQLKERTDAEEKSEG